MNYNTSISLNIYRKLKYLVKRQLYWVTRWSIKRTYMKVIITIPWVSYQEENILDHWKVFNKDGSVKHGNKICEYITTAIFFIQTL